MFSSSRSEPGANRTSPVSATHVILRVEGRRLVEQHERDGHVVPATRHVQRRAASLPRTTTNTRVNMGTDETKAATYFEHLSKTLTLLSGQTAASRHKSWFCCERRQSRPQPCPWLGQF